MVDDVWLPSGHHWDLHIAHMQDEDAGAFTGGGWKIVLHTTESEWEQVDAMENVLDRKNAAPHVVIGGRKGSLHPVVIQMVPFDRAGRALANDASDGAQTNRANAVQIEICGFAAESQDWPMERYRALANLVELIRHRVPVPNTASQDFSRPRRMTDEQWVKAVGYVGHSMCPDNDHTDPGHLREGTLIGLVSTVPDGGFAL